MQVIKKAERGANGRILHNRDGGIPHMVAPSLLVPRVLKRLSVMEQARITGLQFRQQEINREMRAVLERLGLDPGRPYKFTKDGEVIDISKRQPVYE